MSKRVFESTVTHSLYIFNYSTGAGVCVDFIPDLSTSIFCYCIYAPHAFSWCRFISISVGTKQKRSSPCLLMFSVNYLNFFKQLSGFSSVFAFAKELFVSNGLNEACCENNKCIRCSQMMCSLPKKHHLRF